ncbi:hypothetical protein PYW07_013130 [Mythimna separata]|uniref:Uncharacterized protein n=1 Tax=Mythimna separata TaxID=271217 RepID=A0AAD7Y5T2_MYTSE|nr:hypothetical protein PYW07_013130 [Mythimna separata]
MLKCFLCEKTGLTVKKFNEEKLEKCRKIQAFRKKKNLKHLDVVPAILSLQQRGYHIQCFDKFIMLKSNNKKEFDSMFSNGKVILKNLPPLKIDSPNAFKKNTASSSNGTEIPKLIEIPTIGAKTYDIDLKVTPRTYQMDEPSYVNPDISRGVILKSILTRKSPIKKDMMNNPLAFDSGMDLLRYGNVFQQPNLGLREEKLAPMSQNNCLFCGKEQRKIGVQVEETQVIKEDEYKTVLEAAQRIQDKELILKLLKNKNCSIHSLCRAEYKNRLQKITGKNCDDEDDKLVIKKLQHSVFEALFAFIDDQIIDQHKTYFLTDLFERYKAILSDIQNSTSLDIESSNVMHLQDQILKHFEGSIKISTKAKRKVVYKDGTTDLESALIENENLKYDKVAFELRSEIKSMKRKPDGKIEGEIPDKLVRFVSSLIQGPVGSSFEDKVKIKVFCQQLVTQISKD